MDANIYDSEEGGYGVYEDTNELLHACEHNTAHKLTHVQTYLKRQSLSLPKAFHRQTAGQWPHAQGSIWNEKQGSIWNEKQGSIWNEKQGSIWNEKQGSTYMIWNEKCEAWIGLTPR